MPKAYGIFALGAVTSLGKTDTRLGPLYSMVHARINNTENRFLV